MCILASLDLAEEIKEIIYNMKQVKKILFHTLDTHLDYSDYYRSSNKINTNNQRMALLQIMNRWLSASIILRHSEMWRESCLTWFRLQTTDGVRTSFSGLWSLWTNRPKPALCRSSISFISYSKKFMDNQSIQSKLWKSMRAFSQKIVQKPSSRYIRWINPLSTSFLII